MFIFYSETRKLYTIASYLEDANSLTVTRKKDVLLIDAATRAGGVPVEPLAEQVKHALRSLLNATLWKRLSQSPIVSVDKFEDNGRHNQPVTMPADHPSCLSASCYKDLLLIHAFQMLYPVPAASWKISTNANTK